MAGTVRPPHSKFDAQDDADFVKHVNLIARVGQ
jgi:hypothetical protein